MTQAKLLAVFEIPWRSLDRTQSQSSEATWEPYLYCGCTSKTPYIRKAFVKNSTKRAIKRSSSNRVRQKHATHTHTVTTHTVACRKVIQLNRYVKRDYQNITNSLVMEHKLDNNNNNSNSTNTATSATIGGRQQLPTFNGVSAVLAHRKLFLNYNKNKMRLQRHIIVAESCTRER